MSTEMDDFIRKVAAKDAALKQKSAEWLFARVGYVTCSRFVAVIAKTKAGKPTAEREKYLWELVVERITGKPTDHFTNSAMMWGTEQEPLSRMAYESATGSLVEETGFSHHPTIAFVGGSCDGLIGEDGVFESKSPFNSAIHLQTVLGGMPEDHMPQVQGLLWVTSRQWCDFQSYDGRLPEPLCRYVQRVPRDDAYIAALEKEVIAFSAEVAAMTKTLADRIPSPRPEE